MPDSSLFVAVALMLVPVLGMAAVQEDVIAAAADAYLNDPDVVFNITSGDLLPQMLGADRPFVLSIRSAADFAYGHIAGAVNLPFGALFESASLSALPDDNKIIVYCYTGHTASQATAILNILGYDARNRLWRITGWTTDPEIAPYRFDPAEGAKTTRLRPVKERCHPRATIQAEAAAAKRRTFGFGPRAS